MAPSFRIRPSTKPGAIQVGFNTLADTHPELARELLPSLNDGISASMVLAGNHQKLTWRCTAKGHEFTATPDARTQGSGCPVCSNRQTRPQVNDLATTHPDIAAQWHAENNFPRTPQHVTAGSDDTVYWQCPNGHIYTQPVRLRVGGRGCRFCAEGTRRRHVPLGESDTTETTIVLHPESAPDSLAAKNPRVAAEWHPTMNSGVRPEMVLPGSAFKAWWLCPAQHLYDMTVEERTRGYDCPICSKRRVATGINDLATVYPELAAEWTRNWHEPTEVIATSTKKYHWKCINGHFRLQSPSRRILSNGCPECPPEERALNRRN